MILITSYAELESSLARVRVPAFPVVVRWSFMCRRRRSRHRQSPQGRRQSYSTHTTPVDLQLLLDNLGQTLPLPLQLARGPISKVPLCSVVLKDPGPITLFSLSLSLAVPNLNFFDSNSPNLTAPTSSTPLPPVWQSRPNTNPLLPVSGDRRRLSAAVRVAVSKRAGKRKRGVNLASIIAPSGPPSHLVELSGLVSPSYCQRRCKTARFFFSPSLSSSSPPLIACYY
jgi:hypothetical protein